MTIRRQDDDNSIDTRQKTKPRMGMGKRNKATSIPKALLELPSNLQLPPAVTHGAESCQ